MAHQIVSLQACRAWYAPVLIIVSRAILFVAAPFMSASGCDRLVNRLCDLYAMCWRYEAVEASE